MEEERQGELTPIQPKAELSLFGLKPAEIKEIDTDKLSQLLAMKREEEERQAQREFNAALSDFQANVPQIPKRGTGNHGAAYALYEDMRKAVDPELNKRGIFLSFGQVLIREGKATMKGVLRHKSGLTIEESIELPVATDLRANDTQKAGSASSYCQRYLLKAMLGLVDTGEDDDGNAAGTQTISQEEADGIRELLDQLDGSRQRKFWNWVGVETPEEIPASMLGKAKATLGRAIKEKPSEA